MRLNLFSLVFATLASMAVQAQTSTTRVQIINNAPMDPFDLYVDGVLIQDNFVFRQATPYLDFPAGSLQVSMAPSNSQSVADAFVSYPIPYNPGTSNTMMVTGTWNGSPQLDLKSFRSGTEKAPTDEQVSLLWYNGSANADAFDVLMNGNVEIDDLGYGYYTTYTDFEASQVYDIDLTRKNDNSLIFGSYVGDFAQYAGQSITIIASGYKNGQPEFAPWAVLPNGVSFPLPKKTAGFPSADAKIQFIHNSPVTTVDVYADGQLMLNDFAFKTATPYMSVPAGTINLVFADRNSTSSANPMYTMPMTIETGKMYVAMLSGGMDNDPAFEVKMYDAAVDTTTDANQVGVMFYNGAFGNTNPVNIGSGGTSWYSNTAYGSFAPYQNVNAASPYVLDVTDASTSAGLGSYDLDLSFWKGRTAVIFSGPGYVDGQTPSFEPWVALSNGGTFPLKISTSQQSPSARIQIIHNAPSATVDVYAGDKLLLNDFAWRTATPYMDIPAGMAKIGLAPATSTSSSDVFATFPADLQAGKTYIAIASGQNGGTPDLDLKLYDLGQETATNDKNVDLLFYNGVTDAGAAGFNINSGGNALFSNSTYGTFGSYVSIDGNLPYVLDYVDAANSSKIYGSYDADLTWWRGNSAVIMGTGYMNDPANGFQPWVVLSNGGTFALPEHKQQIVVNNPPIQVSYTPNPTTDQFLVNIDLPAQSDVQTIIVGVDGSVVESKNFGLLPNGPNQLNFNLAGLKPGYYYLNMVTAAGKQTIPFFLVY